MYAHLPLECNKIALLCSPQSANQRLKLLRGVVVPHQNPVRDRPSSVCLLLSKALNVLEQRLDFAIDVH